ncbi:hypothetical protein EV368DRAFT_82862 [Lentinula lateritia]|nr:hypothetical protein EV368DRAFT_82862 [Lentinula lateritia]
MGQFFYLINLDKRQNKGDFEPFDDCYSILDLLLHEDPKQSWAGDRIIMLGDEIDTRYDVPERWESVRPSLRALCIKALKDDDDDDYSSVDADDPDKEGGSDAEVNEDDEDGSNEDEEDAADGTGKDSNKEIKAAMTEKERGDVEDIGTGHELRNRKHTSGEVGKDTISIKCSIEAHIEAKDAENQKGTENQENKFQVEDSKVLSKSTVPLLRGKEIGNNHVLRNLSNFEYVRGNALAVRKCNLDEQPGEEEKDASRYRSDIQLPHLADVAIMQITWASPRKRTGCPDEWPSRYMVNRGPWAGDRLDVAEADFDRQGHEWKDVSDKVARRLFRLWRTTSSDEDMNGYVRDRSVLSRSTDVENPFPRLPHELVHRIFTFCAEANNTDAATLIRVASWTRAQLTPILYRAVTIPVRYQGHIFKDVFKQNPTLGHHIHQLCIPALEEELAINLPSLNVLFTGEIYEPWWLNRWPTPKYIMFGKKFSDESFRFPSVTHPILRNVTHLLVNCEDLPTLKDLSLFHAKLMPYLTRLAVRYAPSRSIFTGQTRDAVVDDYPQFVAQILECKALEYVMIFYDRAGFQYLDNSWDTIVKINDHRLLARRALREEEYDNIVNGSSMFWENAPNQCKDWREDVHKLLPEVLEPRTEDDCTIA